jgi:hypothetical protein
MITYIYELSRNGIPFYIGKTIDVVRRKSGHKRKYGKNIDFIILEEVESYKRKVWGPIEEYYISQYKCWGFLLENQNPGGGGPEYKTQESKNKTSQNLDYNKRSKKFYKPVIQYDYQGNFIKEWESVKSVCDFYKIKSSSVSKSCRGKYTCIGFIWKWKNNNDLDFTGYENCYKRPVIQYDKNGNIIREYSSPSESIKQTKIKGILNNLSGRSKSSGGYVWKYK